MNQVIFASDTSFNVDFIPISYMAHGGDLITEKPNEDFIIEAKTPSHTFKSIEVNRETLSIQKINLLDTDQQGEYSYEVLIEENPANEGDAVQIIRQDAVPHQRNSWYIELSGANRNTSFFNQLNAISKSNLLGIKLIEAPDIYSKYPLTFKFIGFDGEAEADVISVVKSPYQYLQMLLTKHVQNFGYNHNDDNAELNSGLADYKDWIADTEQDDTVAVYRLRFATKRKASKTRDERVWQNVYICTKGEYNSVAGLLDEYMAILNGEEMEGGE